MTLGPAGAIEIGHGVYIRFLRFEPDRTLNPQYAHLPDNPKTGIIVGHHHSDGKACEGVVLFDTLENADEKANGRAVWQVTSLDPLTIIPSILDRDCGLHGFIRDGCWVPA